jgi:hypothetical protein
MPADAFNPRPVPTSEWWRQPVRFFQHLLREVDAVELDAKTLIDEVKAIGAGAYIAMGGGFSAWYPTKLKCQRINPHLKGDFLGKVVAASRKAGIRTIVRLDISKCSADMLQSHPDWMSYQQDGTPRLVWEMAETCATGDYWQRENFAILAELLDRYKVDGFFYNMLSVSRCHCERCQAVVRAETGAGVPPDGVRSPRYERWRRDYLARYLRNVREFVRKRAPQAVVIPYHHVRDGWSYTAMAQTADIISAQVSNPLATAAGDLQPQWNHWAAEEALAARALKSHAPPLLIQTGSEFFASRQTAMPSGRLVRNLAQAAAHGANTAPAINGRLEQDDPRSLPGLLAFSRYQRENAQWYCNLKSVARIALVRSQESLDWGPDDGQAAGNPLQPGHIAEFRGIYEMLVQLRYPCDVVCTGQLSSTDLRRYATLVLPAVSCLSGSDASAIDRYIDRGGHVVATADLAAADEDGQVRRQPALRAVPSTPGTPKSVHGGYFDLSAVALQASLGDIPHIGSDGDFWTPELPAGPDQDGGWQIDLRLIGPFVNNAPEFTVVRSPVGAPGLLQRSFGEGSVSWMPWRPGALHHFCAIPEYLSLMAHVLRPIADEPPIRTNAPGAVELVLYRHPRGQVLHAINGAAPQGKPLVEITPLAGFEVRVESNATALRRLDLDAPIPFEREGAAVVFSIPRLDAFAAIALIEEQSNFQTH